MRRSRKMFGVAGVVALGVALVLWLASLLQGFFSLQEGLNVAAPSSRQVPLHSPVSFDLAGSGFDRDTVVSLVMDVSNDQMIETRFPLDGYFNTSLIAGDLLFLGSNKGLKVVSIADPRRPVLLDDYLPELAVIDLHRSGNLLFVVCGREGLKIMTIEDQRLVSRAEIWSGDLMIACHLHKGLLYVVTAADGLLLYDLSDLEQIVLTRQIAAPSTIRSLAVYGDLIFLSMRDNKIIVFDGSDPGNVRFSHFISLPEQVRDILIAGQMLYVGVRNGLKLYSLEDPLRPQPVRDWEGFGTVTRLVAGKEHLYVIEGFTGLRVIDYADHSTSESVELSSGLQTLAEGDDVLFVTGTLQGLLVVDRQRMQSRQVARWLNIPHTINDILTTDEVFFIADSKGLRVVLKNDESLRPRDIDDIPSFALARHDNLLFVGQGPAGVKVYDITSARRPRLLASWPTQQASRLAVVQGALIIMGNKEGYTQIDFSNLQAPRIVTRIVDVNVISVAVEDPYLFAMTHKEGMLIYAVDAGGMELLSRISQPFPRNRFDQQTEVRVRDGIAFIANGRSGLLLVDVRNPRQPRLLTSVGLPGYSKGLLLHQDLAFVVSQGHGISIVDISSPQHPQLTGNIPLGRISRKLLIDENLLYYSQSQKGLAAVPLPLMAVRTQLRSGSRLGTTLPPAAYPGRYSLQVSNRNGLVVHNDVVEYLADQ
ncbi:MAG: hypothetical protein R6W66_07310 [Pelovirga sp.]